ncbi:Photosystem I subunit O [Bienertia sinuspersici]
MEITEMYVCFGNSFERNWLRTDYNVIGFGLIGWLAPSSIPAINGNSLSGLFISSIGEELSHFPTPPALTSQFWLWMVLWHLGLFLCLTFGQIGFKGRTEEYF